jgi:hypothetical protein
MIHTRAARNGFRAMQNLAKLKGIVRPFELGGRARLPQSIEINWRPGKLKMPVSHFDWTKPSQKSLAAVNGFMLLS